MKLFIKKTKQHCWVRVRRRRIKDSSWCESYVCNQRWHVRLTWFGMLGLHLPREFGFGKLWRGLLFCVFGQAWLGWEVQCEMGWKNWVCAYKGEGANPEPSAPFFLSIYECIKCVSVCVCVSCAAQCDQNMASATWSSPPLPAHPLCCGSWKTCASIWKVTVCLARSLSAPSTITCAFTTGQSQVGKVVAYVEVKAWASSFRWNYKSECFFNFLMKQSHCLTMKMGSPMTIPLKTLPGAPFTPRQTTEQQRRSGRFILGRLTRPRLCGVSAPTPLNSSRCLHTDEWKVRPTVTTTPEL